MDLNRVEQVGLRLGFDATDALEYYLFHGKGEWLGSSRSLKNLATKAACRFRRPLPGRLRRKARVASIGR